MEKGKTKKEEKKYLSVVLVPHSSNQVKVLRISSFYGKLLTFAVVLVALLSCAVLLLVYTADENRKLKESLTVLYNASTEQKAVISRKAQEVEEYKAREDTFNQKINEYTEKYREIIEKYVANQSRGIASRSSAKDELGFSNDLGQLKGILNNIKKDYGVSTETSAEIATVEKKLEAVLAALPTAWPANGRISDTFGYRRDPFTGRKTLHEGLDLAAAYGSKITAAAAGRVVKADRITGYGRAVIIDHGNGLSTLYGHASKLLVKEGQTVKKGQEIARVGSSGRSTGPHLHFEVLMDNSPADPLQYLAKK